MRTPSCYPDCCHTCESERCHESVACPACGEETLHSIHGDQPGCCEVCGAIYLWEDGVLWAEDEIGGGGWINRYGEKREEENSYGEMLRLALLDAMKMAGRSR